MNDFKRHENEDENSYIWRICDNKNLIGKTIKKGLELLGIGTVDRM